jgi:tRNA (guanosine-2'-O-)-methyltransferase
MRRADIETIQVSMWGDRLARRIAQGEVDAEFVIRVLEPFATERRRQRLQQVFAGRLGSVTVVMDAICDPHNGAALVRTCEAFGIARIHLVEQGASFLAHAGVARGTHKWVEVRSHADADVCVKSLKDDGMVLVGAHPQGDLEAADLGSIPRLALVLGNEHQGIEPVLSQACDHAVRVPMRGFAESLNVSVSGGILLAYASAGRPGDLPEEERRRLYARGLAVTVPNAGAVLERAHREQAAG